jgi:uncharacterized protein (DUF1501 family)
MTMLDPDISTADARRLLSQPAHRGDLDGPHGWTRRKFLQAVGGGVLGGAALNAFGGQLGLRHLGFETPRRSRRRRSVPTTASSSTSCCTAATTVSTRSSRTPNGKYYDVRGPANGNLAIPAANLLPLDGTFGFHPSLTYMKRLWDASQLAIVHGVGYPNPDLSHFTSMAIWMNGRFGVGPASTGWVGRWLDGQPAATADLMAATIGSSVPVASARRRSSRGSGAGERVGHVRNRRQCPGDAMYNGLAPWRRRPESGSGTTCSPRCLKTQLDLAKDVAPVYTPAPTGDEFVQKMTVAARLINANLGFRVLDLGLDSFDTHDSQPDHHASLLTQLDTGLATFFSTLDPAYYNRVTVMTMSEFGRTPYSNDSVGTDHGTANVQFVMGPNVRGGHYGQPSSFATINDQWDRFDMTTDFRHVLGTVLDGWMGGGGSTILNGPFQNLGFFLIGPAIHRPVAAFHLSSLRRRDRPNSCR